MIKHLKRWLIGKLICAVVPDDVISAPKGNHSLIYLNGQQASETEIRTLKAEVSALKNFRLWSIFQETVRQMAINKGMNESLNYEQVLSAKMMLYVLDVQKSIIETIDRYKLKGPIV